MRTCDKCGCYIPDGWEVCPACGLMTADSGGSGGAGVLLPGAGENEYRGVVYAWPEEKQELQNAFELLNRFDGNAHVEECSRKIESFESVVEGYMGSCQTNIYDVVTVNGNGFAVHFPVPRPRGSIRKQMEDIAAGEQEIIRGLQTAETELDAFSKGLDDLSIVNSNLRLVGMGFGKWVGAKEPMDQMIGERLTAGFRR